MQGDRRALLEDISREEESTDVSIEEGAEGHCPAPSLAPPESGRKGARHAARTSLAHSVPWMLCVNTHHPLDSSRDKRPDSFRGNIQDVLADDKTHYGRRFGILFEGLVFPFGPAIVYHPISSEDKKRQTAPIWSVSSSWFIQKVSFGRESWTGDLLIVDADLNEQPRVRDHR